MNDTYLGLWNAIPKERPSPFSVFASRITRNLALKKYEYLSAEKRKPEAICSFEELGDCVSGKEYVESEAENRRIEQLIDTFLCQIGEEKRNIFLCRYWYFDSIEEICRCTGYSQSKIICCIIKCMRWGDNADSYGTASKYIRCWHNGLPVTLCVKWWMTNEGNLQAGPPCNSKAALPFYYRSKPFCLGSNLSNSSGGILLSSLSARLQRRSSSERFMLWSKL